MPTTSTSRRSNEVAPGALIVVRPGEKIPLDGVVDAGQSDVNQAPITGESLPVERGPGDEVFAGTINGRGALDIRVTRAVRDTTLARIVHLVESAQAQRAPAQQFIDRFARWYTPAVVALAAAIFVVPVALGGAGRTVGLPRARAAGGGVPVRARHLHAGVDRRGAGHRGPPRRAHQGRRPPRAARLGARRGVRQDRHAHLAASPRWCRCASTRPAWPIAPLAAAAAVESRSEHPIARAVVAEASRRRLDVGHASDVQALPGLGAEGRWRDAPGARRQRPTPRRARRADRRRGGRGRAARGRGPWRRARRHRRRDAWPRSASPIALARSRPTSSSCCATRA